MPSDYEHIASEIKPEEVAASAIETLSQLYADRTHFLYELIQNADDVKSHSLAFRINETSITAWNKGRTFNPKDIRAICSVGDSIKDLTQIGTHGIGFKAVYLWTERPSIFSGDERFCIEGYIRPIRIEPPAEEIAILTADGHTVFVLPFKPQVQASDRERLISELGGLHRWTLLFLDNLAGISWQVGPGGVEGAVGRKKRRHPRISQSRAHVVDLLQGSDAQQTFLVFRTSVLPKQEVIDAMVLSATNEKDKDRLERSRDKKQPIEIAFAYRNRQIVPEPGSVLFSYLPTDVSTGLQFLIQARYQTTPARDNIAKSESSVWNRWLIDETAQFLKQVLPDLKEAGLLTPSLLETLPNSADLVPHQNVTHVFDPIRQGVLDALRGASLIPTTGDGHGRPERVFYPHSQDLVELFAASELTGRADSAWLHSGVRWGKNERAGTLVRDVGVTEWTARKTVDWLRSKSAKWFARRSADWLNRLYGYLAHQESEWSGLKDVAFLRLASGSHVRPDQGVVFFQPESGGRTDVLKPYFSELPVIASTIDVTPPKARIRRLLESVGVTALRPAPFIEKWLLPQHRATTEMKTKALHTQLALLTQVWDGLSQAERDRLEPILRQAFWLCVYKVADPAKMWITTSGKNRIYLASSYSNNDDLDVYFASSPDTYFLDPEYLAGVDRDALPTVLKALGICDLPQRITTRAPLLPASATSYYYRFEMTENWTLDGLEAALSSISEGDATRIKAGSLWQILRRIRQQEQPAFFQGKYRWLPSRARQHSVGTADAHMLTLLRQSRWLPDETGTPSAPGTLFAPTNVNKTLLGASVPYLHSDFDVRDTAESSPDRLLASLLNIRLGANTRDVIGHLIALSETSVELAAVMPLYEFLRRQDQTVIAEAVLGKKWILSTTSGAKWWRTEEAFWKDESALFGEAFGYIGNTYPFTLKAFFTALQVAPAATVSDCIKAVEDAAQGNEVVEQTRTRLYALYQQLLRAVQGGLDSEEEVRWQAFLDGPYWLGKCGQDWEFYVRGNLVREDKEYTARLFRDVLPFWHLPYADPASQNLLQIEPSSKARMAFRPLGDWVLMEDWTARLHSLSKPIRMFLASKPLNGERVEDAPQDILDRLRVCRTENAVVTYELNGKTVEDLNGRPSHLEVENGTVWLRSDAHPDDYPEFIGDALEGVFGTSRLQAFVKDLLPCVNEPTRWKSVMDGWHRRGLTYETPTLVTAANAERGTLPIRQADTDGSDEAPDETLGEEMSSDSLLGGAEEAKRNNSDLIETRFQEDEIGEGQRVRDVVTAPTTPLRMNSTLPSVITTTHLTDVPGPTTSTPDTTSREPRSLGGHWGGGGSFGGSVGTPGDGTGHNPGGHGSGGGLGGERPEHEWLKTLIAENPILLGEGLTLKKVEYQYQSLDKVDVLLEDHNGFPVTVEVEAAIRPGSYVGVWQAVKYQHLAAMEYGLECGAVRTVVVAPYFPEDVLSEAERLGVECLTQPLPTL